MRRLTVSLQGKQVGEVYTVTNEQSNLEKAVTSSLSNGPGEYTREDWRRYHLIQLGAWWASLDDRAIRRLRKKEPRMIDAIEGILKHG